MIKISHITIKKRTMRVDKQENPDMFCEFDNGEERKSLYLNYGMISTIMYDYVPINDREYYVFNSSYSENFYIIRDITKLYFEQGYVNEKIYRMIEDINCEDFYFTLSRMSVGGYEDWNKIDLESLGDVNDLQVNYTYDAFYKFLEGSIFPSTESIYNKYKRAL